MIRNLIKILYLSLIVFGLDFKLLHAQCEIIQAWVADNEISEHKNIPKLIFEGYAMVRQHNKLQDTLILDLNLLEWDQMLFIPMKSPVNHKKPIEVYAISNGICSFGDTIIFIVENPKYIVSANGKNPIDIKFENTLLKLNSVLHPHIKSLPELSFELKDKDTLDALETRKNDVRNIVVIDKIDIERFGYFTAAEILRTLPGVYFEDVSENNLPQMRGAPSGYTQVLIDGERLPDGNGQRAMQADRIPASMIERVEIIRSPDATQDAQGIAGSINIILKKSNHTNRNQLNTSYGSTYTKGSVYQASLINEFNYRKWHIKPKTAFLQRGNGKDRFKRQFSVNSSDKFEEDLQEIFYNEFSLMPDLHLNISKKQSLNIVPLFLFSAGEGFRRKMASVSLLDPDLGNDTISVNSQEEEFTFRKRNTLAIRANYANKLSKSLQINAFASFAKTNQVIDIERIKLFELNILNQSNRNYDWVNDYESIIRSELVYTPLKYFKSIFRAESLFKQREIDRNNTFNGFQGPVKIEELYHLREFRTNMIWNNQITLQKISLNAGFRVELVKNENTVFTNYVTNFLLIQKPLVKEGRASNFNPFFNINHKFDLDIINKFLLNLIDKVKRSAQKSINNKIEMYKNFDTKSQKGDWVLKPNITRSVKRPDFNDLNPFVEYRDGTFINPDRGGNPQLKPEHSWNFDLATEYYFKKKKGVVGVNYYQRIIQNMVANGIEIDPWSERYTARPLNIGNGTMSGLEFDFRYNMPISQRCKFTSRGNFTRPRSAIRNPQSGQRKSFKNQPDYFFNIAFDLTFGKKGKLYFGNSYNHYPGFHRENIKMDGTSSIVFQLPIYRIDSYAGFCPIQNMNIRFSAHNFLKSQKFKKDSKISADGTVAQAKIDQEIYRPVYNVSLSYDF